MIENNGVFQNNKSSFTEAEHQFIAMKIVYQAEKEFRKIDIENQNDLREINSKMLKKYQDALNDKSINFVSDVPQYFDNTVTQEIYVPSDISLGSGHVNYEFQNGNHVNAITRGNPYDPDEIVVTFPGTDFGDRMDRDQTVFANGSKRQIDYTEEAIQYISDLKEKYPDAKITVNGHSMAGKLVMAIGMMFPDVEVYAFNPTALDKKYREMLKEDQHYDNINVFVFDKEIAGLERWFRYGYSGRSMKDLPFNVYHMDSSVRFRDFTQISAPLPDTADRHENTGFFHKKRLSGAIEQHSSGGYRSVDGHLIDLFQLNRIDFSSGGGGTKEIIFSKEKYLHFANIIRKEFIPNLRKALATHEEMEENIDNQIRRIVNDAEDRIWEISVEPDAIYSDPRGRSIEDFKDKYYRSGKYRCYDGKTFEELLDLTDELWRKMNQFASLVEQTAIEFDNREQDIANQMYERKRS